MANETYEYLYQGDVPRSMPEQGYDIVVPGQRIKVFGQIHHPAFKEVSHPTVQKSEGKKKEAPRMDPPTFKEQQAALTQGQQILTEPKKTSASKKAQEK